MPRRDVRVKIAVCPPDAPRAKCASVEAVADTGAERSIFPEAVAKAAGISINGRPSANMHTATGTDIPGKTARAAIASGRVRRVTVDAVFSPTVKEALLGQDYLARGRCVVDVARRRVRCRGARRDGD